MMEMIAHAHTAALAPLRVEAVQPQARVLRRHGHCQTHHKSDRRNGPLPRTTHCHRPPNDPACPSARIPADIAGLAPSIQISTSSEAADGWMMGTPGLRRAQARPTVTRWGTLRMSHNVANEASEHEERSASRWRLARVPWPYGYTFYPSAVGKRQPNESRAKAARMRSGILSGRIVGRSTNTCTNCPSARASSSGPNRPTS
jgi:hypothetical protein